jgi:hypothetical protein
MLVAGSFAQQKTRRGNAGSREGTPCCRAKGSLFSSKNSLFASLIRPAAAIDDGVRAARRRRGRAPPAPLLLTPHFGGSRSIDRFPLRRVKILGESRVLCHICSPSERLSMTASGEAIPQCHAGVRGHEKVGSSEIPLLVL